MHSTCCMRRRALFEDVCDVVAQTHSVACKLTHKVLLHEALFSLLISHLHVCVVCMQPGSNEDMDAAAPPGPTKTSAFYPYKLMRVHVCACSLAATRTRTLLMLLPHQDLNKCACWHKQSKWELLSVSRARRSSACVCCVLSVCAISHRW